MKKINLFLYVIIAIGLFSCEKHDELTSAETPKTFTSRYSFLNNDTNNVSVSTALAVAGYFSKKERFMNENMALKAAEDYEIDELITIPDENNEPAMYVLNFSPAGFIILSATKKVSPVLGFSDKNNYTDDDMPPGLEYLLDEHAHKISAIRKMNNYKIPIEVIAEWNYYINSSEIDTTRQSLKSSILPIETVESYGPLLATNWKQGVPYNNEAPNKSCTDYSNGRCPVGCATVAVAQVLRYHAIPSDSYSYLWRSMPGKLDNNSGTNQIDVVANLMIKVAGYLHTSFTCDGSSGSLNYAPAMFKDIFGYQSGGILVSDVINSVAIPTVAAEIKANRPVLMGGYHDVNEKIGHGWVIDGYKFTRLYINLRRIKYINWNKFHMNWGWEGTGDGWYELDDLEITQIEEKYNFQYKRSYIINIKP